MGMKNTACCCQTVRPENECLVPSSDTENTSCLMQKNSSPLLYHIKPLTNISSLFEFICSSELYSLIIKDINGLDIMKKVSLNLTKQDIISTISKVFDWISIVDTKRSNLLKMIKNNIQFNKKTVVNELLPIISDKETKDYYIKCLANLGYIVQFIQYSINNQTDKKYNVNYWKDKKVEKEMSYLLNGALFNLIMSKMIENNQNIISEKENYTPNSLTEITNTFINDIFAKTHN